MIFAKAFYLWLLPILLALAGYEWRKRGRANPLFDRELGPLMLRNFDRQKRYLRKVLFYAGLFFLIIALAKPQWGEREQVLTTPGIDMVFAVDVSKSMLATDLKPSRLENARQALRLLTMQLAGNRLGLVAFAGSSFVECPLTGDVGAVQLFLDSLAPGLIPVPGTDLGGAIHTAVQAFDNSPTSKAIILITDGEDLAGGARGAAGEAAGAGIKIFPIGIGTAVGETVPEVDENGRVIGLKRDKKGELVVSRLDLDLLNEIAGKTGGKAFFVSSGGSTLPELMAAIATLPKNKITQKLGYQYYDRFQIFLFLAFVCLAVEFILSERKK
ncbi:MAG: VWA domain-containing protein [Candidatus Margulisbacteria bacterium]|nr:VWA domain-containing protein [Candidatus Margulisiibacteriota bacterium]